MHEGKGFQVFESKLLTYGAYLQVTTSLQHSNRVQLTYKMICSMWLMATFIGAGYALSSHEVNLPVHPLLIVPMLCLASLVVIMLIWHLDLIVQEQQIASAVCRGLDLEKNNPWLPQVYSNVEKLNHLIGYVSLKSSFYLGVISIQSLAMASSLGYYLYLKGSFWWPYASGGTLIVIPLVFLFCEWLTQRSNPYAKIKK